ncbi:MAG TPA: tetratricopeptide repeat protein [Pyrinomonadaceae bacterium]|nr:tetratricopeptide repeat protein [Pyrinomonadaceae bacterium]
MRFRRQTIAALVLGLVGAACQHVAAQTDDRMGLRRPPSGPNRSSSISGRVNTPGGRPPGSPTKITLRTPRYTVSTVLTDQNGEFNFTNLPKDTYCLDVVGDSKIYRPTTECVVMERDPSLLQLTIYLKIKEDDAAANGKKAGERVVSVADLDPDVPPAAKQEFERAGKLKGAGETEEAIRRLREAITIYPRYQAARLSLASLYRRTKQTDEAIEQYQAILAVNEQSFAARLNLGVTLVETNKFREAAEQLAFAVGLDSADPQAHLYLGIARLGSDAVPAAYEELSKALILGDASYAVAHYYLAFVHLKRGERQEAAKQLNEYLAAAPQGELADDARALLGKLK